MTDTHPSLLTRFYYNVKPFVPKSVRWALRRRLASDIRIRHAGDWPINESAGIIPHGWPGWPDDKSFALVLTHDVESAAGVDKVRALAEIEMRFGVRSCFNFIPEGGYHVPRELRNWLLENSFEVGVYDLRHDGKLYQSQVSFKPKAQRINHYLHEWNATGFRSGFMLRQLEWLHDLDIEYECSTFDTDPFEPQPAGAHTIFPYWIPSPNAAITERDGYVELPYTLPQDSTIFLLLREPDAGIWKRKTDWIIQRGGMVLINVHPDYIDLNQTGNSMTFPVIHYEDFLKGIMERYKRDVWQVLPREIAQFVIKYRVELQETPGVWPLRTSAEQVPSIKIWIDLENTPHIPFFRPIIRELRKQGHQVVVTARDGYQTCEMAEFHALEYQRIGHHYGKKITAKALGFLVRSVQMLGFAHHEKPELVLNLGSRSQNLTAKLLDIPVVEIMDYEHTAETRLLKSRWYLTPKVVCDSVYGGKSNNRIRSYEGIKEDVYLPEFHPDESILDQLDLRGSRIIATVRPAATEAHYHNPEAELLFARFMERILACTAAKAVLLPRNKQQETDLRCRYPEWFESAKVLIPTGVVDGLNLIWHSDLVVSGGGTMNREASAMRVPVYSVFRGRIGAVDRWLCDRKRLVLIESLDDVDRKILLEPRTQKNISALEKSGTMSEILQHLSVIIDTIRSERMSVPS